MNNKKKTSRFDELIDAARSRQQRDIESGIEQPIRKTKSTDPDYIRTTIYLPKQLHRRLKTVAASQDKQMSDIVTELIENWLQND